VSEGALAETKPVDVGERLRAIRRLRRRTLKEVATGAGLSESFLSQVERGRTNVTITSLQRIAGALGVEVSDVFTYDGVADPRILRRADRRTISFGDLARKTLVTPKPFAALEVVHAEFEPGGTTGEQAYTHGDSEEVFFVVRGEVELQLGDEIYLLAEGDAAHYRSSTPHRVRNRGAGTAEVLYMISPPSY
jgi:transcriptional regulator with XRE-family HTH domain